MKTRLSTIHPLYFMDGADSFISELFASLLGRQIVVDEDVAAEAEEIPQDGLRIFG
jgi:hypothetical protein